MKRTANGEQESRREPDRPNEVWTRDPHDPDLWHGAHGVIVNGAALAEREVYYRVVRRVVEPQVLRNGRLVI